MFALLMVGIAAVVFTIFCWAYELREFNKLKTLIDPLKTDYKLFEVTRIRFNNARLFFKYGQYFIKDILITMASMSILGMGEGVTGGVLGLIFSDAVSVFLIWQMNQDKKRLNQMRVVNAS